jgi:hypothetical protein
MKIFIRLLCYTLICFGCRSLVVGQAIVEPADQPLVLNGILKIVHGYGPPGYGLMESTKRRDLKISYWALELPVEVTLACIPDRPELADIQCGPTRRLRLFFPVRPEKNGIESKARKMIGRTVMVTGSLYRRAVMVEMTPVFMEVTDIALVRQKR